MIQCTSQKRIDGRCVGDYAGAFSCNSSGALKSPRDSGGASSCAASRWNETSAKIISGSSSEMSVGPGGLVVCSLFGSVCVMIIIRTPVMK